MPPGLAPPVFVPATSTKPVLPVAQSSTTNYIDSRFLDSYPGTRDPLAHSLDSTFHVNPLPTGYVHVCTKCKALEERMIKLESQLDTDNVDSRLAHLEARMTEKHDVLQEAIGKLAEVTSQLAAMISSTVPPSADQLKVFTTRLDSVEQQHHQTSKSVESRLSAVENRYEQLGETLLTIGVRQDRDSFKLLPETKEILGSHPVVYDQRNNPATSLRRIKILNGRVKSMLDAGIPSNEVLLQYSNAETISANEREEQAKLLHIINKAFQNERSDNEDDLRKEGSEQAAAAAAPNFNVESRLMSCEERINQQDAAILSLTKAVAANEQEILDTTLALRVQVNPAEFTLLPETMNILDLNPVIYHCGQQLMGVERILHVNKQVQEAISGGIDPTTVIAQYSDSNAGRVNEDEKRTEERIVRIIQRVLEDQSPDFDAAGINTLRCAENSDPTRSRTHSKSSLRLAVATTGLAPTIREPREDAGDKLPDAGDWGESQGRTFEHGTDPTLQRLIPVTSELTTNEQISDADDAMSDSEDDLEPESPRDVKSHEDSVLSAFDKISILEEDPSQVETKEISKAFEDGKIVPAHTHGLQSNDENQYPPPAPTHDWKHTVQRRLEDLEHDARQSQKYLVAQHSALYQLSQSIQGPLAPRPLASESQLQDLRKELQDVLTDHFLDIEQRLHQVVIKAAQ